MRDERESYEILERALNAAQADEADAAFLSVDHNITRFANSQIIQNMSEESASLTLRVILETHAKMQFAGAYATGVASVACGNTHGVRRYATMSDADATVIAIAEKGSGYATQRARSN